MAFACSLSGAIFFDVFFMVDTPAKVEELEQRLHDCLGWY